jgi:hypothetical protein
VLKQVTLQKSLPAVNFFYYLVACQSSMTDITVSRAPFLVRDDSHVVEYKEYYVTSCTMLKFTGILNQALPIVTGEDVAGSFIRKFCKTTRRHIPIYTYDTLCLNKLKPFVNFIEMSFTKRDFLRIAMRIIKIVLNNLGI